MLASLDQLRPQYREEGLRVTREYRVGSGFRELLQIQYYKDVNGQYFQAVVPTHRIEVSKQ